MQQYQTVTHQNAPITTFLPLCPPCPCSALSSPSLRGLCSFRRLKSPCARHTVPRRKRVRISAEQAQTPDTPSDEGKAGSPPEPKPVKEEDEEDFHIPLPNAFEVNGDARCVQCSGKGEIDCPVCSGSGFLTLTLMDTVSSSQCRMCLGRKIIPCPTCRQIVFKSVLWWDQIPSAEEDPEEKWRDGPDGPKFGWGGNPAGS